MVESRLEYNGNKWRIITLYSQKMEDTMETLREKVQEEDEEWVLVKGDFNARTGSRGGPINEKEEKEKRSETRKSEDKVEMTAGEEINMVEEGIRTESDYVPLEVELTGPRMMQTRRRKKEMELERSDWTEDGRREYHEKCEGWSSTQINTEDIWKEIKEKVKSTITKQKKRIIPWRLKRKEWYNKKWKERKRRLRRLMREKRKDQKKRVCEGKKGAQGMV
ncbi:Axoneme-associated protein [Temnothorax longispinosus]|uniref:Axoneme-associated protein n=1 Tax=Temnothorax longispinosus TaxID=300112 RepID=A0A4S2KEY9_9HYME|nr:Axoneme-associated protein [Temnothorax longispinosus]